MPKRETLTIPTDNESTGSACLQATVVRADTHSGPSGPRPMVIIHRGILFDDADVEFMDELADGMASAGMTVIVFEPRATGLLLDDFHAFTLDQSIADLAHVIRTTPSLINADSRRLGVIGWAFGATSAIEASRVTGAVSRLCLINPATPSFIASRSVKTTSDAAEMLPHAVMQRMEELSASAMRFQVQVPMLILHAAADRMVPAAVSQELVEHTTADARMIERVIVARADHAFAAAGTRAVCIDRCVAYFSAMKPIPEQSTMNGGIS